MLAFSLASAILIEMGDTNTVKCPLCRVDVLIDKIDLPNRCLHPQCPLKRGEIPAPKKSTTTRRAILILTLSEKGFCRQRRNMWSFDSASSWNCSFSTPQSGHSRRKIVAVQTDP